MKAGDIVRVAFVQKDEIIKPRPAVLLKQTEPDGDWITCGITSKLHKEIKGTDIILHEKHPDFDMCGLSYPGLIRTAYLITVPKQRIEGVMGNISTATFGTLLYNLKTYISQ